MGLGQYLFFVEKRQIKSSGGNSIKMEKMFYRELLEYLSPEAKANLINALNIDKVKVNGFTTLSKVPTKLLAVIFANNEQNFCDTLRKYYYFQFESAEIAISNFSPDSALECLAYLWHIEAVTSDLCYSLSLKMQQSIIQVTSNSITDKQQLYPEKATKNKFVNSPKTIALNKSNKDITQNDIAISKNIFLEMPSIQDNLVSSSSDHMLTIAFTSDLHLDWTNGDFRPKDAKIRKTIFINYIKEHCENSLVCLNGDFFNDYKETLLFVKELEKININGFFVLGNHDYWNNGTKSYLEIINIFEQETKTHGHFRFLTTGKTFYIDDICVIGDTGWTSFRRNDQEVPLQPFNTLPETKYVKNFNLIHVKEMHKNWISFANETVAREKKVLILTHFPMTDFTNNPRECWWSSQTDLLDGKNYWNIFGHTHKTGQKKYNHISSQIGYYNPSFKSLEQYSKKFGYKPYSNLGILEKISNGREMALINVEALSPFNSPLIVADNTTDISLINSITRRGYIRCSLNNRIFSELAKSPEQYINKVQNIMDGYLTNTYIGFTYLGLPKNTVDAVYASIAILQIVNVNKVREFITAAVVTGYVYNQMPELIAEMRPIDDYDIIRFYLMFLTVKKFDIGIDSIDTVRMNSKRHINFRNIDIYLPEVNGQSLSIEEVLIQLKHTNLLSEIASQDS